MQKGLEPLSDEIINGEEYPGRSKMWNDAIQKAKNEIVIIIRHQVRPKPKDVQLTLDLSRKNLCIAPDITLDYLHRKFIRLTMFADHGKE